MPNNTFSVKDTFKLLFLSLAIILAALPFTTTFNEFLTRIAEHTPFYNMLENTLVPYMSKLLFSILRFLPGLRVQPIPSGVVVNGTDVLVTWNCLGWQSVLIFSASLLVGLRGKYTFSSTLYAVTIGILGTFLMNVFRLLFTAALVGWWRGLFVILFHNYFASFLTIIWLFYFWWFSYAYVLEEK